MSSNKRKIEAILFASGRPVSIKELREVCGGSEDSVQKSVNTLKEEYDKHDHAFEIREMAEGIRLKTREEYGSVIEEFMKEEKEKRLSRAALETLSIVAYEQPITRARLEEIRGVRSGSIIRSLLDEGFVEIVDRKEAPGRPMLYGTTDMFLEKFGLSTLEDLPEPESVTENQQS